LEGTPDFQHYRGVEGCARSPGIRLGRGTRRSSLNLHPRTNHKRVSSHSGHPWVLGQATGTLTHKTHHGPDSGEAITFPHIVFSAMLCISDGLSVSCECIREHPPSIAPNSIVFLCFLSNSIAAMMNLCSNSEEQSDPKLIEYRQVADKVWEAGRCDRQEIGKLISSKPTLNSDGNGYFTSSTPSSDRKPSARARFAQPKQDLRLTVLEISAS